MNGAVSERERSAAFAYGREHAVMSQATERHYHAKFRHGRNRIDEKLSASIDLGRNRLVLRRHAADGIGNCDIDEF